MKTWMTLSLWACALGLGTRAARAEPLTLDALIAQANRSARVTMAEADRAAAAARVAEADGARLPRVTATAFAAPSPEIRCVDAACTATDPTDFALRFSGAFIGGTINLTQPLYTFGKISAGRAAAKAGLAAQAALEAGVRGDVALDAARAYWGLKVARELRFMLEDGIDRLTGARDGFAQRLAENDPDVTLIDQQRLDVIIAEATAQLADAQQGEAQALAAVRALAGDGAADIDAAPLTAVEATLAADAALADAAVAGRPEVRAADAAVAAMGALTDLERAGWLPDLALIAGASGTVAQGVDDPPSAFANDPYNRLSATLALALRWQFEPGATQAKVGRARAASQRAVAQAALARTGARYDVATAAAEARGAQARLTASASGEQAAKAWLAAVVQADAVGTAEAKDLADAYIAWFQMRARQAQAIYQWNVAVARLARATGEYPTTSARPTPAVEPTP
ncbi:MAG: TolC family protein [Kofleriaceae bacterium]